MEKPEKKIIPVWILGYAILAFVLAGVISGLASRFLNYNADIVFLLSFTGLAALSVILGYVKYRAWRFTLRNDHVYLEHGVFIKVRSMVPYVRVQHIDTRRSILDRLLGLSKLVVYTAGSRGADVTIPGLLPERAEEMQQELRDLAIDSEDRDGV